MLCRVPGKKEAKLQIKLLNFPLKKSPNDLTGSMKNHRLDNFLFLPKII